MAPGYVVNRDNQQLFSEERKLMPTAEKVKITSELSCKSWQSPWFLMMWTVGSHLVISVQQN